MTVHEIPEKGTSDKLSLPKLLAIMDQVDQGLIDMPLEELEIKSQAKDKVDGLYKFIDAIEQRVTHLEIVIRDMTLAKRALLNKLDSVENFVTYSMKQHGFEKLPGNDYQVALRESEAVEVDPIEITPEVLETYRPYIRTKTTHEWDKTALKPDLKTGAFELPFARIKKNQSLKFTINRKGISS